MAAKLHIRTHTRDLNYVLFKLCSDLQRSWQAIAENHLSSQQAGKIERKTLISKISLFLIKLFRSRLFIDGFCLSLGHCVFNHLYTAIELLGNYSDLHCALGVDYCRSLGGMGLKMRIFLLFPIQNSSHSRSLAQNENGNVHHFQ